jgi:mannose-6-phosphate isomerase
MSVLKLKPACKDYLWGGDTLIRNFHKKYDGEKLAETWELSCHPDGMSVISNGLWQGKSLAEYVDANGKAVLGDNCKRFQDFPILIKFIDAKDNLSIQVHPNDYYALKNEGQYGKTEMWYIADCKDGAFIYYGFAKEIDQSEFRERIENNTLPEVLNKVSVHKGDVFFIEAGTIHAIGQNIVVAEIQQNSNITYRVYDYGRKDKEGRERELHIEKAIEVTNRHAMRTCRSAYPHLAACDYFIVDKLNLDGKIMQKLTGTIDKDSFMSFLVVEGNGTAICNGEHIDFIKGDSLFFPAGCGEFQIEGECEALVTTIGKNERATDISIPDLPQKMKEIMLSDEDSILWELCGGDLDNLTEQMVIKAAQENDETAKTALHQFFNC